jgi:hypothetical protein
VVSHRILAKYDAGYERHGILHRFSHKASHNSVNMHIAIGHSGVTFRKCGNRSSLPIIGLGS